ncbi:MAG: hypothetical protein H3C68_07705 [Deltaproteobacteria bacterium]|nr:hypothetical protein [Deltaproteobacteria bacterium]MBZ0220567.1 hypothetical protein [Deltaproteobacteria bacterium]
MSSLDWALTIGGIAYGVLLIFATFINNKTLAAFRLDALFMRTPSESTRGINLLAGLALIGYNVYTIFW